MRQAGRQGRQLRQLGDCLIRQARPADSGALARLIVQLGYPVTADEVSDRLGEIEGKGRMVLVAVADRFVVGCLTTSLMKVIHRPAPVGRISMMVVDEAWRGQGIGKQLVRAAERHLLAAGCQLVEVTSNFAREDAHAFYERLGFEKTSVRLAREPAHGA